MDNFNYDANDSSSCPKIDCNMTEKEPGELDVVAVLRLITACLSILGAFSIVSSACYRKTACNPRVHPIFVLSIADLMLSILWISGSVVWLNGGVHNKHKPRVGCFTINLMTVILQCVAMNLTLIYALLAYSSIKQRDFTRGVYMVQQGQVSVHVWPPLCSLITYIIAWTLPIVLIMVPFWVLSVKYGLVNNANECSCWCLPFYGNVIPRPSIGYNHNHKVIKDGYLLHLHYFIASYATVLTANFSIVFVCMIVIYYKVFRQIRRMRRTQEQNENMPLYGATQAMILEGQKDAKKRVFLFLSIYVITGIITCAFGMENIVVALAHVHGHSHAHHHHSSNYVMKKIYIFLLLEAMLVPLQGCLNAMAYGWTRGDFLNVMSASRINSRSRRTREDSFALSYDAMEENEETVVEDDGEEWEGEGIRNSLLFSASHEPEDQGGGGNAMTPGTPGVLLGEEDRDLY